LLQQSVTDSAKSEKGSTFKGNGYISLAVIYAVFALSNWTAPSIVAGVGPKITMIIGGALYCLFIASFLKPMTWLFYLSSVLVGFGAAIIWTGQGTCFTMNSDSSTLGRNSGIFWALLQCSLLWGNLFTYFQFQGEETISSHSRTILFLVLSCVCVAGVLVLLLLRKPTMDADNTRSLNVSMSQTQGLDDGAMAAFKASLRLFRTKEIMYLAFPFAYTGLELTFFSGVYGTCVGHTQKFGDQAKSIQGLTGVFIGLGEITGGALFGLLGKKTTRYGRSLIVLLGFFVHMLAFFLIFLYFPFLSPIGETDGQSFISPNKYIVMVCAFFLGFADSCYNTQIFSILGSMYAQASAPAFAIFKFIQSVAAAVGFFYSVYLLLQWQLLILTISNILGVMFFALVEWEEIKRQRSGYTEIR